MTHTADPSRNSLLSLDRWGAGILAVLCSAILASFVASVFVYKIWYVATIFGFAVALQLMAAALIRADGLMRALAPLLVYFVYLASTSLWAQYPMIALTWAAIDSIEIPVFVMFYVWALNSSSRQLLRGMVALAYLCLPIAIVLQVMNPEANRFGGRGATILPILVPFCWILWRRGKSRFALGGLVSVLGMLFVSRSRMALLAALVGLVLSALATSRDRREFLRSAGWLLLGVAALTLVLLALPPTRALLAETYSRLTYEDVTLGDMSIEAEAIDEDRWAVLFSVLELWWDYQPLGMGHMNFMGWFEQNFGIPYNVHNSLLQWSLEGGLPCLVIMAWLLGRYFRIIRLPELAGDVEGQSLATALRHAMIVFLLICLFHPAHQTPAMYALLGMGYAFARRYVRPRYLIPRDCLFATPTFERRKDE